jgi:hypothetical protein
VQLPPKYFNPVTGVSVPPGGIITRRYPPRQALFRGGFHGD